MASIFKKLQKNTFLKYGAPLMILLVGGSKGLQYFAELRYKYRKVKMLDPEEAGEFGITMKKNENKPTLESEYKKMQEVDIDNWQNIRGPRPWEDSKTVQDAQRQGEPDVQS